MSEAPNFVLYEHAVGYALLRVKEFEDIGMMIPEVCFYCRSWLPLSNLSTYNVNLRVFSTCISFSRWNNQSVMCSDSVPLLNWRHLNLSKIQKQLWRIVMRFQKVVLGNYSYFILYSFSSLARVIGLKLPNL